MSTSHDTSRSRGRFLSIMLGSIVLMFSLVFLVLITGGFFVYFLLLLGLAVPVGLFHYALWGRSMEQQTSGDREQAEILERVAEQLKDRRTWTTRN